MGAKTDTREKILQTAAFLFQKNGYHATGLNEIIKVCAAPKGSLYYHFPNGKEELAVAAINLVGDKVKRQIEENLAKSSDPVQSFQGFLTDLAALFEGEDPQTRVSLSLLALETSPLCEPLRDACTKVYGLWGDTYCQKLIHCGFPQKKATEISSIILLMVEGAVTISFVRNDSVMLKAIAEQIPRLIQN